jgi:hypothetical protein
VGPFRFSTFLFALLLAPHSARAIGIYTPYLETGFGYSIISGGQNFFSPSSTSAGGAGFGLNAMLGFPLLPQSVFLQPHIGFKTKLSSASATDGSLGVLTATPMLRLETPRFYIGVGLSPLVWRRVQPAFGFDGLEKVSGALGYMAEAGLLWRVVPFFHVALEGGAYMVSGASGFSPKPAFDASFQMRFFFWEEPGAAGGGKGRRKFDGWRYPFGMEL